MEKATFGAGCFWGVEAAFGMLKGVSKVTAGYAGGSAKDPSYYQVVGGNTGHVEAVQIEFDPQEVTYQKLLDYFWQLHDPTVANRQGNDVGTQYQAVIFYHTQDQKELAEKSRTVLVASGQYSKPIVTEIKPYRNFYEAEEEHQQYLAKHPGGYCHIDLTALRQKNAQQLK